MPRSSIPPLSQPLQNHFRGTKRSPRTAAPANDKDANPFLSATPASPSWSTRGEKGKGKEGEGGGEEGEEIRPGSSHSLRASRMLPLGQHHATMLSLHSAVEHALVVHLATSGGSAVDASSTATNRVQLPNVVTYATLRPIVERSCGRRLGTTELARLMWLWGAEEGEGSGAGCNVGFHVSRGRTMDRAGNKSYDYYLSLQVGAPLPDESDESEDEGVWGADARKRKISADGIPVVPAMPSTPPRKRARLLDLPEEPETPSPSPRSINVFAKQPHLQTPPPSPSMAGKRQRTLSGNGVLGSPGLDNRGGHNSLGLVAMWNSGIEGRKREVRRRLVKWTLDCYATWLAERQDGVKSEGEDKPPPSTPPPTAREVQGKGGILTPSASREEGWIPGKKRIKDFFADERKAEGRGRGGVRVHEWDASFPLDRVAPIPLAALPEGPIAPTPVRARTAMAAQRIKKEDDGGEEAAGAPSLTSSPAPRLTLAERIQAKEEAKRNQLENRAGLVPGSSTSEVQCRSSVMANLQRRSALARLQGVAESMYMLFNSSKDGDSGRIPHLPINNVAKSICNSSKAAMSESEARQAMAMLRDLAPGFVEINKVGTKEWVRLGAAVQGESVDAKSGGLLGAVRRRIRVEMDKR